MKKFTSKIVGAVKARRARQRDRLIFSQLSDQTLKDIGMIRDDPFYPRSWRKDLPF